MRALRSIPQPGRGLAATGLALLALLLCAAGARADAAQVTVVSPGGGEQTLALEALAGSEDVVNRAYVLRSSGGESSATVTGFSLAKLIDAAGADPYGFSYLEVQRPSGGAVLLSRHQALDSSAFAEGPPVIYATPAGTAFLRPSDGAEDLNAEDSFEAPQGMRIVLRKDSPLRVRAEASTLKTKPGKPVDFSAVLERAGAGERVSFSWSFDDGGRASGAEVSHAFKKRGSYDVVVGVTAAGNEAGSSDVVTIQVGAPIAGPDRKGGGRNEAKDAPDHGAAAGPGAGPGSGLGSSPLPPAGLPVPAEVPATPEAAPQPAPAEIPPPEPEGEEVSGELLSASSSPPPPEEQPQAEARRGSLDGGGGGGGGLPAAAWGGLATLGLLGTGALIEARGLGGLRPGRWRGGIT